MPLVMSQNAMCTPNVLERKHTVCKGSKRSTMFHTVRPRWICSVSAFLYFSQFISAAPAWVHCRSSPHVTLLCCLSASVLISGWFSVNPTRLCLHTQRAEKERNQGTAERRSRIRPQREAKQPPAERKWFSLALTPIHAVIKTPEDTRTHTCAHTYKFSN